MTQLKHTILFLTLLIPSLLQAAEPNLTFALDTLWVTVAAILVFFMQAGFALLEMGLHSSKNAANVLMKNMMDFSIASIGFWAIGFMLMFGNGNEFFGTSGAFLSGGTASFSSLDWSNIPLTLKFIFQLVFAGTAATIISGSIGGRSKFLSYLVLSLGVTTVIYPVLGHWVWGGGWLSAMGFFDFAGSTVVHGVGGFCALAAIIVIGPRKERLDESGQLKPATPSSLPMVGIGTLVLWLGWFGFNAGSTMGIVGQEKLIGHILLTTNISAAAAAIVAMFFSYKNNGIFNVADTINGALAGLVGITAGCAFVSPFAALVIGICSGALVMFADELLRKKGIDDAVSAVSVHGICGVWGTVALGLFAAPGLAGGEGLPALGLFYGGGLSGLIIQSIGAFSVAATSFSASFTLCMVIKKFMGIRVSESDELVGLDTVEHGKPKFAFEGFTKLREQFEAAKKA